MFLDREYGGKFDVPVILFTLRSLGDGDGIGPVRCGGRNEHARSA